MATVVTHNVVTRYVPTLNIKLLNIKKCITNYEYKLFSNYT
jgi:hypothetical protein